MTDKMFETFLTNYYAIILIKFSIMLNCIGDKLADLITTLFYIIHVYLAPSISFLVLGRIE